MISFEGYTNNSLKFKQGCALQIQRQQQQQPDRAESVTGPIYMPRSEANGATVSIILLIQWIIEVRQACLQTDDVEEGESLEIVDPGETRL